MSSSPPETGCEAHGSVTGAADPFALEALQVGGPVSEHRCYYAIAGVTLQVESELPFAATTFAEKFTAFEAPGPGPDTVVFHHQFEMPPADLGTPGRCVYRRPPWAIHEAPWGWLYRDLPPAGVAGGERAIAVDAAHTRARFFNGPGVRAGFARGGQPSLTLMPTDQILVARLLADREAAFVHSCGIALDGEGLLFVGESGAGKSTAMSLFAPFSEPLCDDRNIVRRWPGGFRVHGTWSHGSVPIASPASAPLRAVFFLEKADGNAVTAVTDRAAAAQELLPRLVRPLMTRDWLEKTFDLVATLVREVPCYRIAFDRGGGIVDAVRRRLAADAPPRAGG
ncbi:MAG: hypothetical protein WC709_08995 [Thermoleophilia bacterium]